MRRSSTLPRYLVYTHGVISQSGGIQFVTKFPPQLHFVTPKVISGMRLTWVFSRPLAILTRRTKDLVYNNNATQGTQHLNSHFISFGHILQPGLYTQCYIGASLSEF